MTDALQAADETRFLVVTDNADGFHYVLDTATGERLAGPYPLRKTANRRARQEAERIAEQAPAAPEALEPVEPEGLDRAVLEEALDEAADQPEPEAEEADEGEEGEDEHTPHAPEAAERRPADLTPPAQIVTREDWLLAASIHIAHVLADKAELELPAFRVACGWPHKGGTGRGKRVLGQCWNPEASSDQHAEIFISPMEAEAETVFAILAHELIHACLPKGTGHKAPFVAAAKAIGFAKPFTQLNPTDDLWSWARPILATLPAYPHAAMNPAGAEGEKKKQTTRQLKVECPDCGLLLRGSRKALTIALPICGVCKVEMVCEDLAEGDAPEGGDDE